MLDKKSSPSRMPAPRLFSVASPLVGHIPWAVVAHSGTKNSWIGKRGEFLTVFRSHPSLFARSPGCGQGDIAATDQVTSLAKTLGDSQLSDVHDAWEWAQTHWWWCCTCWSSVRKRGRGGKHRNYGRCSRLHIERERTRQWCRLSLAYTDSGFREAVASWAAGT